MKMVEVKSADMAGMAVRAGRVVRVVRAVRTPNLPMKVVTNPLLCVQQAESDAVDVQDAVLAHLHQLVDCGVD